MTSREEFVRQNLARNFITNLAESSICMLGFGFIGFQTFLPVFIGLFTDSRLLIGVVGAAVPVGWLLPQLLVAGWVESLDRKKAAVIRLALAEKMLYLVLAALAFASFAMQPEMLVGLCILVCVLIGLAGGVTRVGWGELMAAILPAAIRGRYFGAVSFTGGLLGALGAYLGGLILSGFTPPSNYALTFFIGFCAIIVSWTFLFWIREPPPDRRAGKRVSTVEFVRGLADLIRQDREFVRFVLAQCGVVLSGMAFYFIAVAGQAKFALTGYELGLLAASLALGTTLTSPGVGWLGDRYGHRVALIGAAGLQALGFGLAAVATNTLFLYAAGFVIGASRAGTFVNAQPLVYLYAPVSRRPTYIGLSSTAFGAATMAAPILGGAAAQAFGYTGLFLLSLVGSLMAVAFYWARVKEPAGAMP